MNLPKKLWFLNISLLVVMLLGIALIFMDHKDSVIIITTMLGVPLAAYSTEMGIYAHSVAYRYKHDKAK